ncbi:hypothetical protein [Brumimicrobium mesophilum]|uniref:hypothetical protein n=1 Tax=Brumimicrobium mesophilum TaxID=392717 RepID=UPI0018FE8CA6|nr:hypothetical protein [Brumimicrobium mesophilum]
MKTLITVTLFFFCWNLSIGQVNSTKDNFERNTIYAEAFGQGFCWSLNYDRLFNTEKRFMNSFTAGLVYVPQPIDFGDGIYYGIPVSYNWLLGKKSHHLELGIGLTSLLVNPHSNKKSSFYAYLTPKIGYRFQRLQGGLFFRATLTPMIDILSVSTSNLGNVKNRSFSTLSNVAGLGFAAFPWPGLSIGYTFK